MIGITQDPTSRALRGAAVVGLLLVATGCSDRTMWLGSNGASSVGASGGSAGSAGGTAPSAGGAGTVAVGSAGAGGQSVAGVCAGSGGGDDTGACLAMREECYLDNHLRCPGTRCFAGGCPGSGDCLPPGCAMRSGTTDPDGPTAQCGINTYCDSATEICVMMTPVGPGNRYECRPLPAGCENDRSCDCTGAALCTPPFDTCSETAANHIICGCPGCQ